LGSSGGNPKRPTGSLKQTWDRSITKLEIDPEVEVINRLQQEGESSQQGLVFYLVARVREQIQRNRKISIHQALHQNNFVSIVLAMNNKDQMEPTVFYTTPDQPDFKINSTSMCMEQTTNGS